MTELAARQIAMMRALAGGGDPPAGFAAGALDLAAAIIRDKRRRGIRRHLRAARDLLGEELLESELDAYLTTRPLPREATSGADAFLFTRFVRARRGGACLATADVMRLRASWRAVGGRCRRRTLPVLLAGVARSEGRRRATVVVGWGMRSRRERVVIG